MNSETLPQIFSKGFRVTLGATASFVEVLQDAQKREERISELGAKIGSLPTELPSFVESFQDVQKREENLSKFGSELGQLTEEWEAKGEVAEQDVKIFVENMVSQVSNQVGFPTPAAEATVDTTASPVVDSSAQAELQELTAQLAAVREEIAKLNQ